MHEYIQQKAFTRRDFLSTGLKAGAAAFTTSLIPNLNVRAEGRYNVLFIMVDDLRPLLGCYGHTEMHTPNIDRLAARGTVFNRAYCQYPLCSPSRTSFITGLRPDTTQVTDNRTFYRETVPNAVTLPQHFKENGYHSQSVGRVLHLPDYQDDENSWSVPSWRPRWRPFDHETTPSWQALDVDDDDLRDGEAAIRAVQVLNQIKDKQFFLAVGFYKPHLPFKAPKKYFELYENTFFNLPGLTGKDATDITPPHWNEVRPYADIPNGFESIPYNKILELARAYAATTSYTDAQIGRVLDQLDALGLTENTVIAFCGDHGYNFTENGTWGKNIVYEATLHSPLIVSIPGQGFPGERTDALVELVDIFPTLCDACEIPILPESEGLSMLPVIKQPTIPWKTAAFSQRKKKYSIRTDRFRYTEEGSHKELYDYSIDPYSEMNIANNPENAELVTSLSEQLHSGWEAAFPEYIPPNADRPNTLQWDVNDDGIVDMQDLLLVSNSFGEDHFENPKVDVNKDGNVDIIDLLIIAAHLGESSNGSSPTSVILPNHIIQLDKWLTEAHEIDDGSVLYQRGIMNLEQLLNSAIPNQTVLLANFPNPFNPETWIPYDLAEDTDVSIHIYNQNGKSIRHLKVGFQTTGTYRTQSLAAHWDGRNSVGEPVASGIYFYTFQAGPTIETRKMVIKK